MTDTLRHESYFEVTYVRRNRKCLEKCGKTRGGGIRWGVTTGAENTCDSMNGADGMNGVCPGKFEAVEARP